MITRIPILLGFGQGLLLLLLHEAIRQHWPVLSAPEFAYPAYAIVLLTPVAGLLSFRFGKMRELVWALAGLGGLLILLGFYAGHIAYETITRSSFGSLFAFGATMLVMTYIALPFLQSRLRQGQFSWPYSDLYEFGWLNTLVIIVACAFTGLVWILLSLWAALFAVLDIRFFSSLFFDRYFIYPATGVMFSYGLSLGLQRFNVGIVQKVDFLFRAVMVLVALIVVLFLFALLVSGVKPLWDTGKATFLLLWLQLFVVLFINGIFQRGDSEREGILVRWSMTLPMLVLPILAGICAWALYLRVDQYGWTVDRVWAVLIIVVMPMYAVGYAVAAARNLIKRTHDFAWVAPANIATALSILLLIVLVNSPLLSPVRVAANSQVARLLEGKVAAAHFDYNYLRFNLGRVGLEKLESLKAIEAHPERELIRQQAGQALLKENRWSKAQVKDVVDVAKLFEVYPAGRELDGALTELLRNEQKNWPYSACFSNADCLILFADMNGDGVEDAVMASNWSLTLLARKDGKWEIAGRLEGKGNRAKFRELIRKDGVRVVKSPWKALKSGDDIWHVVPN